MYYLIMDSEFNNKRLLKDGICENFLLDSDLHPNTLGMALSPHKSCIRQPNLENNTNICITYK